ncbi:S-adenosyl-L-methionine-dependent methyltransferase [Mycena vitilis]|nr:S-adenosyl-L-methionine-dependent methyltransferase [Mycena vitilis]
MPPPRRPTAFEVSFPEEAAAARTSALEVPQLSRKRKQGETDESALQPSRKRVQRMPAAYYEPNRAIIVESAVYRAPGEDGTTKHAKPLRILSNYCVFEPAARNELVPFDVLEAGHSDREFAAEGIVLVHWEDEEDYEQEDGANANEVDSVRLNDVALHPFDYFNEVPICLETQFAVYELRGPSMRYKPYLMAFLSPRYAARMLITRAIHCSQEHLNEFRAGKHLTDRELRNAIPYIRKVIHDAGPAGEGLRRSMLVQDLLSNQATDQQPPPRLDGQGNLWKKPRKKVRSSNGNTDQAMLREENHTSTHVTPLIADLAKGYFEETLRVVGAQPKPRYTRVEVETHKHSALSFLKECIARTRSQNRKPIAASKQQHQQCGRYATKATIGDEVYEVGDIVCIRKGHYRGVPPPSMSKIPDDAQLAEYFWFARIVFFDVDSNRVHVQWLEHGSQIILGEFAHPQELFLTLLCDDVASIDGKVHVSFGNEVWRRDHYFIRALYDERDVSFTSLDQDEMDRIARKMPPDNCLPCRLTEAYNHDADWSILKEMFPDQSKGDAGVSYQGHKYHPHDFFLYNAGSGPAHIGYIQNIQVHRRGRGMPKVHFTKVGRAGDLEGILWDEHCNIFPERHLILSNDKSSVLVNELIRPIHVYALEFFVNSDELQDWVDYSPYNFYCSYRLPSLAEHHIEAWSQRVTVPKTLNICQFCPSDMYRLESKESLFDQENSQQDYHVLDVFGGTGAFSQALAEGSRGLLNPTHLIEITPSAAQTARKNSKNLVTYCQDANIVLRYFIKSNAGYTNEVPRQLFDNETPLPPPIPPGKMRAIIAGLPCQSYSGLNMYRTVEDHRSNLLLTLISYVDFFKPDFLFLENVPAFLRYKLLAEQVSRHRVDGGIEMGALKLLLRALLDMRYQVRFALLQAGHYGAPQNRIRFFLIAARHGQPLPDMPQPTLRMRMPYGHQLYACPIRTTRGRAPHRQVSVGDAIGDLPSFDWAHPDPKNASRSLRSLMKERNLKGIPAYKCDRKQLARCGDTHVAYKHEPRTSFQRQAREKPTEDLQHFTGCLPPKTVERVVTIPLRKDADFRSLPDSLAEWQFHNPVSSVGRRRYRAGLYGRLDNDGYFPTTVTNIHPTAKQSKVLHPDCLRMVSVRELARSQGFPDWFVFVSTNENVVLMHRQIGNAVPWQVSRSLGRELRVALFKNWKRNASRRDGTPLKL